jgi:hypothetical protein
MNKVQRPRVSVECCHVVTIYGKSWLTLCGALATVHAVVFDGSSAVIFTFRASELLLQHPYSIYDVSDTSDLSDLTLTWLYDSVS